MAKIIACIAARMESERLPGKVMRSLCGHPMNEWLVQRLKSRATILDDICICTPSGDSNEVIRYAASNSWGIKATSGTKNDILKNFIDSARVLEANHFLRITGDNVFTDPEYINVIVDKHLKNNADYTRVNNLPLGVTAEVMSLEMAFDLHKKLEKAPEKTQYMLLYSFDPDLYKCCVVEAKPEHRRPYYSCTIDSTHDFIRTEKIIQAFPKAKWGPSLSDIIEWMDANPDERKGLSEQALIKLPLGETIKYKDFLKMMDARAGKSIMIKSDEYELI